MDNLPDVVAALHRAQSVHDLEAVVARIDTATAHIDKSLRYSTKTELRRLQHELSGLELARAQLAASTETLAQLRRLFLRANDLGHSLTSKIKRLDAEIGRVQRTCAYVGHVQVLRNNLNHAFFALEHRDYAAAARCIHTIALEVPPALITGRYAAAVIPLADMPRPPHDTLVAWRRDLTATFEAQFEAAAARRDTAALTRCFQLFPMVGAEEAGLVCYSRFICLVIADTLRALVQSVSARPHQPAGIYSTVALQLFENILTMLAQHGPLIQRYYGHTASPLLFVIKRIQGEVDSQIGLVSDTFYDMRRIDKVRHDIALHRSAGEGPQEELVSVVAAADLMGELASILRYWAMYCRFITTKYIEPEGRVAAVEAAAVEAAAAQPAVRLRAASLAAGLPALSAGSTSVSGAPRPAAAAAAELSASASAPAGLPPLIAASNFTYKVHHTLVPALETLCAYYLRRSLEKAIEIEELPSLDALLAYTPVSAPPDVPPVSSVVEDATLVVNTALRCVLDSGQLPALKHFVAAAHAILDADLLGYFARALRDNHPRYNTALHLRAPAARSSTPDGFLKGALGIADPAAGAAAAAAPPKLANFVLMLNSLAVGHEYLDRIVANITAAPDCLPQAFPFGRDSKVAQQILDAELREPFARAASRLLQDHLVVLYNQLLKNHMATLVADFLPETAAAYVVYGDVDTAAPVAAWQALVRPYRQTCHRQVYHRLLRLLVVNLANLVEKRLLAMLERFRVNDLGALRLERELLVFIAEVCEDNFDLRDKFVRVTQLVLLVGMDDDEYAMSVVADPEAIGINWVLTPGERKRVRRWRV